METNTEKEKEEVSSKTLTNMVVTRTDANESGWVCTLTSENNTHRCHGLLINEYILTHRGGLKFFLF